MKHFRLFAILCLVLCSGTTTAFGQTQEPRLDVEFTDIPLAEAIAQIEKN